MYQNFSHLFKTRKFTPFFTTQFLSAFNDNLFKFALVLFLKFQMTDLSGEQTAQLTTIAAGLFILPFFLFSALAGQLADKYEKSYLIRIIRFAEIPLMILAAVGFYLESATFLLGVLFLMGTKSAFFGPLKYSLLPEHLKKSELIAANGLIEMATFVSILIG
ncbi:MAG: MFS transporter, partial [Sphingomonadales bacterium]